MRNMFDRNPNGSGATANGFAHGHARVCIRHAWLALLVGFLLMTGGCGESVIRIGLMADLSGRGSGSGLAMRNGAMLAVEEVNARGGVRGKRVSLHIKDDKGLADTAVAVDKELVTEGIALAIGHLNSGPGLPGVQVLLDAGIPVISPAMGTGELTGLYDGFFRLIPESVWQGRILAKAVLDRTPEGATVSFLLEENNMAYCVEVESGFQEEWETAGRNPAQVHRYKSGETVDFDRIAGALLRDKADVVVLVTGGLDLAVFTQLLRKQQPTVLLASGMWGMTHDFLENAGRAGDGVLFPHLFSLESRVPAWQAFEERYRKTFFADPLFSSGTAYESVMIACEAMERADSLKGDDIRAAILAGSPYQGLQETISLDEYGDCRRSYRVVTVRDGSFVEVFS